MKLRLALALGCVVSILAETRAEDPAWVSLDAPIQRVSQPPSASPPPPPPTQPTPGQSELYGEAPPQSSGQGDSSHPQIVGDLIGAPFIFRCLTVPALIRTRTTTTVRSLVSPARIVTTTPPPTLNPLSGILRQPSGPPVTTVIPAQFATSTTVTEQFVPGTVKRVVGVPLVSRAAFKISENEGAGPTDRLFFTYNYFSNVRVVGHGADQASISDSFTPDGGGTSGGVETLTEVLGADARELSRLNVHRQTFGFEKVLFGDDFSVGMRLPILQQTGANALDSSDFGDMSAIFKYALLNDRASGDVFATGLMVTVPTGSDVVDLAGRRVHPTLLQPFIGYAFNFDRFFVQGFNAAIIPLDSRDVTLLANDLAVGYRLYQPESGAGLISSVIPVVEGHLTTPLDKRGRDRELLGFPDVFVMTGAVHIGMGANSRLTFGVAAPLTGPQPFDVEGVVQFNLRF